MGFNWGLVRFLILLLFVFLLSSKTYSQTSLGNSNAIVKGVENQYIVVLNSIDSSNSKNLQILDSSALSDLIDQIMSEVEDYN